MPRVADGFVHDHDDHLALALDFPRRPVDFGHPVEGLLRRRDVVPKGGEQNDGFTTKLLRSMYLPSSISNSPCSKFVAHKEAVDDGGDLLLGHEIKAAPPLLEGQVTRPLGIHLGVEVVLFAPQGVGRVEILEIGDQVGTVEEPVAQVAGKRIDPHAA